jgi:branched-chain amino acid transport system ATP-binding protein
MSGPASNGAANGGIALETIGLRRTFGGLVATNDVSLRLATGSRHALIGPNGAGKTTFINLLTGVLRPSGGQILLNGEDITTLPADQRVRRGVARTFQINQLFAGMTPLETVGMAVSQRMGHGAEFWRAPGRNRQVIDEIVLILDRFGLTDVMGAHTGSLPYGKQRLLEIAVAIACQPRVLLLDEPAAGVPEGERDEILAGVAALPADVTVLLIEHDMDLVFRFAERISVLVSGALLTEGTVDEVANDPRVKAVYLGEAHHG